MDKIADFIKQVSGENIKEYLLYLSKDPLPCRCMNYTIPGHNKNTLYEADDYIIDKLKSSGYEISSEVFPVQAFQKTDKKAGFPFFRKPEPSEPWYNAYNILAEKKGLTLPDEVIVLVSHKDSQSWLNCAPGAYDNAAGVSANIEISRILNSYKNNRTIRFLFCNEEHWPWTSAAAAENMAKSGQNIIAVLNVDSIGGKPQKETARGKKTNITRYCTSEGEQLADLMEKLNKEHNIGLHQNKYKCEIPNDDDGSFVNAGIHAAVLNIGSFPYADPDYHTEKDIPENVDITNVEMAVKLNLAAVLHLDRHDR